MGILETILGVLVGVLKAIPYFDKWFTKTPTQKVEEGKEQVREDSDHMAQTGRPPK
jgi:hypothetical protein